MPQGRGRRSLTVRVARRLVGWYETWAERLAVARFIRGGRRPWSPGYTAYKHRVLREILRKGETLARFAEGRALPAGFGLRLDERVVEYPWVLSRLRSADLTLLDAGGALVHDFLLELAVLPRRSIVAYSLASEGVVSADNVSYIRGDLRDTILREACFDEVVCLSTLEHVGMDNTRVYAADSRWREERPDDYQRAVRELRRVLKPGGQLLVTVPYGRYENHGWLQQFDRAMVERVVEVFAGAQATVEYFKYADGGWQRADADTCMDCRYFDVQSRKDDGPDYGAAARAVACMELIRSGG